MLFKSTNKSKGVREITVAEVVVKESLMIYNRKEFYIEALHNLLQQRVAAIVRGILNVTSVISYDCTKFKNLIFMRSKLVIMVRVNLEFHRKYFVMGILRRDGLN